MIPAQVAMIPLFLLMKQLGLINTYWAVILPLGEHLSAFFSSGNMRLSIPDSLSGRRPHRRRGRVADLSDDRAAADAADSGDAGVFTFMTTWNDFMWPLVVLIDSDLQTLPVGVAILSGEHVQDTELMMAASVVTLLPVLVLFLFVQRYYVAGILAGGLKE